MQDKKKPKEDWTSLSLTIAVIVFAFLGYFTFVAFLSTKPESEAAVDWLLKFMDKYGAFLASIPVLFAVLVAKQQLDTNRRQHVANVKREHMQEIDAIELAKAHLLSITSLDPNTIEFDRTTGRFKISRVDIVDDHEIEKGVSNKLHSLFKTPYNGIEQLDYDALIQKLSRSETIDTFQKIQEHASKGVEALNARINHLSQYWS